MNGRFYKTYKEDVTFKMERNKRECLSLAKIIDQMMKEKLGKKSMALEMAIRRLTGVQSADLSDGNWSLCDDLDLDSTTQSFLPQRVLKHMLANTSRLQALQNSNHKQGKLSSSNNKSNNNNYNNSTKKGGGYNKSSSSNNKPTGAASNYNSNHSSGTNKESSNQK